MATIPNFLDPAIAVSSPSVASPQPAIGSAGTRYAPVEAFLGGTSARRTTPAPSLVSRRALSALRRRKDVGLDDETANAIEDTSDDPEVVVQKKDTSDALRKCLTSLSPEHREIVDLVYYHEKSVEEVAEIVGIPENTVKTRLFYARKKLAELLKAAGIERGWP